MTTERDTRCVAPAADVTHVDVLEVVVVEASVGVELVGGREGDPAAVRVDGDVGDEAGGERLVAPMLTADVVPPVRA